MEELVEDIISKIDDVKTKAVINNEFEVIRYYCNASYYCIANLYKEKLLTKNQYEMYIKRINEKMQTLYFELKDKYNVLFLETKEIECLLQSNKNAFD